MKKLRTQLSLAIFLLLLFIVGLFYFFSNWFINSEFEKYITESVQNRGRNIVTDLGTQYDESTKEWNKDNLHIIGMSSLYDGYILTISDNDGNVVWDAENHDMSLCGQIMNDISTRMEKRKNNGDFVTQTYDVNKNGEKVGIAAITYYGPYFLNENDFAFISTLNKVLLAIGILAIILSIVIGNMIARRISRPVTRTADIAKEIVKGNYDNEFEYDTKTRELNDLVVAINHLTESLSEQEKLRKRMTTDIAHELRTPLTAVSSHLEAMIDGLWEVTPQRLQGCYDEIERLGILVSDLQRLAKIEGENLNLNKTDIDLKEVALTVVDNMTAQASKKNQSIEILGGSVNICADKDRMNQVVHNLLSNAIKYSLDEGIVKIEVSETESYGVLKVADDGIGIPEDELPFVFERFYRADKSRNRNLGGAGIGLAIVKSIVLAHEGDLTAQSVLGQGSCFTVSIPKKC